MDEKIVGEKQNMVPMWKVLQKEIVFEDATSLMDQVYLGCTQRDAKVDLQTVLSKTKLF